MAKHPEIDGVGTTVNLGIDGPILKDSSGVIHARNSADSDYAFIKSKREFGGGYFTSGVTITCTLADTYYKVNASFSGAGGGTNITFDDVTNKRFDYSGAGGTFVITMTWTGQSDTATTDLTWGIYKTGTLIEGTEIERGFETANSSGAMATTKRITLATNDYIEIYVKASGAGVDAKTKQCNLEIIQID